MNASVWRCQLANLILSNSNLCCLSKKMITVSYVFTIRNEDRKREKNHLSPYHPEITFPICRSIVSFSCPVALPTTSLYNVYNSGKRKHLFILLYFQTQYENIYVCVTLHAHWEAHLFYIRGWQSYFRKIQNVSMTL
jgi:hypothetical protein